MKTQKIEKDAEILEMIIETKKNNPNITKGGITEKTGIGGKKIRYAVRVMKSEEAVRSVIDGGASLKQAYLACENTSTEPEETKKEIKSTDNKNMAPSNVSDSDASITTEIMPGNEEKKTTDLPKRKKQSAPMLANANLGKLTSEETRLFAECEGNIKKYGEEFMIVASALLKIRNNRLYREKYSTFIKYCKMELPFTARRAIQLSDAAEVYENLNGRSSFKNMPNSEWQIRPLLKLKDPASQAEAWRLVNNTCPDGIITESIVSKRVAEILKTKNIKKSPGKPKEKSNSEMESIRIELLLEIINLARENKKASLPVHRETLTSAVLAIPSDKMETVMEGLDPEEMSFVSSCIPKKSK